MMDVKGVCKGYNGEQILSNISLHVGQGERVLLTGVSGRGKTTLLRIMMGLIAPDSGEVTGAPKRISAVFQEDRLPGEFTPLACIRATAPKGTSREAILRHLSELGLGDHAGKPVSQLSGGQRRRVSIIQAMLSESDAVYLDEPFTGLDAGTKSLVCGYINKNADGRALIIVSHDETDAEIFGARVIRL